MLQCNAFRTEKCAEKGGFSCCAWCWAQVPPHLFCVLGACAVITRRECDVRCFDQCLAQGKCSKAAVFLLLVALEVFNCLAVLIESDCRRLLIPINPSRENSSETPSARLLVLQKHHA